MSVNNSKNIRPLSIGERLQAARSDLGVGLEQASRELSVAFKYLEALENDRFSDLPGQAYLRNYLTIYCQYLGLSCNEFWEEAKHIGCNEKHSFAKVDHKYFLPWPKLIRYFLISLLAVAVAVFLVVKVVNIFTPPELKISFPPDGFKTSVKEMDLVGQSEKEAEIFINNRLIFVDNDGNFGTKFDLQKGLNLIKITAKKRHGRENEVNLRVLYTD
ncbi:MAG: helix-turn-helix domain-containing protein [bacterium]